MKRRTVLWTAPAVVLSTAAPAFAASGGTTCDPLGCRHPGEVRRHAYRLADCADTAIAAALIDGVEATQRHDGGWWIERDDSRHALSVTVTYVDGSVWTGVVGFPPHTNGGH